MTQLSRMPIHKDVFFHILDDLYWLLAEINTQDAMKLFLQGFFTKTERLMLAKRLAVALMVTKGYDYEIIKKVLKVSTNTIYRINNQLEHGEPGFKAGLERLIKEERMNLFWEKVNNFIDVHLVHPHKAIWPDIPK